MVLLSIHFGGVLTEYLQLVLQGQEVILLRKEVILFRKEVILFRKEAIFILLGKEVIIGLVLHILLLTRLFFIFHIWLTSLLVHKCFPFLIL